VENYLNAPKANEENTGEIDLKDVYAELGAMRGYLRTLEVLICSCEERLAQICKDTDSKVGKLWETTKMLETKLSETQKTLCCRDEELMSQSDMRKELWQDLRQELHKELKELWTDMTGTKEKAKDEIAPTSANDPSALRHNVAFTTLHNSNLPKSGEEPPFRPAKEWHPVIQPRNLGRLGKVEHQEQKFNLRPSLPRGVSKCVPYASQSSHTVTNGRLNLQVNDLGARKAGQIFPSAPHAPQDCRPNMRMTSTLGAWRPCKTR